MRHRPRNLIFGSLFLSFSAAGFAIQGAFSADEGLGWSSVSGWLLAAWLGAQSAAVYRGARIALGMSFLSTIGILLNYTQLYSLAHSEMLLAMTLVSASALMGEVFILLPDARVVLSQSKERWWNAPARRRLGLQTHIRVQGGGELDARTFDLSESGVFIPLQSIPPQQEILRDLGLNSRFKVQLNLAPGETVGCTAEVVRHATARGAYPPGFGARFVDLTFQQRVRLSNYLSGSA